MAAPQRRRILVVEDEGLIAHDIARRLEALGHTVVGTASTADEAIQMAPQADLVLMDIRIDGERDGIEAACEVRERHHIPVIFLTAHADRETLDRAKAAGPFGYIVKPLGPSSLQTAIEMAVHKHQVDRQLEEREVWLRTTVNTATEAIIAADERSRIRLMNPAAERLTGWKMAEAQGQSIETVLRLVDGNLGEDFGDPAPLAILRGSPMAFEAGMKLVARNGRQADVEGTAAPAVIPPDTLGVVIALRDVTLRHWEERQLRQAQRMETAGRLAARISGEYAFLIDSIRTQTEKLLKQFGSYGPAREAIDEIQRTATAAAQATRRLADFGGRQVAHMEVLSVNAVIRRMSKLIESTAGPSIGAAIRSDGNAGRIRGDSAQIEQAILNLVLHACSAMPQGGQLLLETNRAQAPRAGQLTDFIVLTLTYSHVEPDLEHLFDPEGAGENALALAVTHGIVTEHGGYLMASAAEGGTRIDVFLPRLHEELAAAEPVEGESSARAQSPEAPTILLVDYRDRVRAHLHTFFESAGYNVIEAATREEAAALAQIHEGAFDLLIADAAEAGAIQPELRGAAVLEIVEGEEVGPHQIRRPFTQQALLEHTEKLLALTANV